MRLFADHDVYASTTVFLRSLGHDVETASEAELAAAEDERILGHCARSSRALVTRDKDFGTLVFHQARPCPGVVLIRAGPARLDAAHGQLGAALASRTTLVQTFIVVEPSRFRVRRAPGA